MLISRGKAVPLCGLSIGYDLALRFQLIVELIGKFIVFFGLNCRVTSSLAS